jgi:hypothetical protein
MDLIEDLREMPPAMREEYLGAIQTEFGPLTHAVVCLNL